jgi:hypothetical protein
MIGHNLEDGFSVLAGISPDVLDHEKPRAKQKPEPSPI